MRRSTPRQTRWSDISLGGALWGMPFVTERAHSGFRGKPSTAYSRQTEARMGGHGGNALVGVRGQVGIPPGSSDGEGPDRNRRAKAASRHHIRGDRGGTTLQIGHRAEPGIPFRGPAGRPRKHRQGGIPMRPWRVGARALPPGGGLLLPRLHKPGVVRAHLQAVRNLLPDDGVAAGPQMTLNAVPRSSEPTFVTLVAMGQANPPSLTQEAYRSRSSRVQTSLWAAEMPGNMAAMTRTAMRIGIISPIVPGSDDAPGAEPVQPFACEEADAGTMSASRTTRWIGPAAALIR